MPLNKNTFKLFSKESITTLFNNIKIAQGEIKSEQPRLSQKINQYFIEIQDLGRISAYNVGANNSIMQSSWDEDLNKPILFTGIFNKNLYLLDSMNNKIIPVNSASGSIAKSIPLLWEAKKIELKNNLIIVQSERKLYVITL